MYHGQLAHYCAGTGCKVGALVVVESSEPHDVGVYVLDDDALWSGEVLVSRLLARVAECEASGEWPGAMPRAEVLPLPAWARISETPEPVVGDGEDDPIDAWEVTP